ncbi:uncharacterized protein LOC136719140 [Amia ocellicauda]|uniref:uncharacterized protein LOC136719140 n=1 Tax=Amia ocellicauda TaxID=2972642 RepID=UPI003463CEB9
MRLPVTIRKAVLSCLVWMVAPGFLRSEFKLAYVTDFSLYTCTCLRDQPVCGLLNSSKCDCSDHPFSALHCPDGPNLVHGTDISVWYTSPLNVALLLNNSKVHQLTLVKCDSVVDKAFPVDYFAIQGLVKLTVTIAGNTEDIVLGREKAAPYCDEANITIIHPSVLTRKSSLKAYTVWTPSVWKGVFPFPYLNIAQVGLQEASIVTFLYSKQ